MSTPYPDEIERLQSRSISATVPGEVRLDLIRAGKLEDAVFYGRNNEKSRWVEDCDWWYWRDFDLKIEPHERAWLVLDGADYYTWAYLNGNLLGRHEGMFSRQIYEITCLGQAGSLPCANRLAVRFMAPARLPDNRSTRWHKFLNRIEHRLFPLGCDPDRRDTLKCQMSYGWDFAPALRTIGLWDQVKGSLAAASARLTISFDADAPTAGPVTFALSLAGQTFAGAPITGSFGANLPAGRSRHTLQMDVPEPHLWWPWDHGQ